MATRRTTLHREVLRADPEWPKDSKILSEYVMSNGRKFERRTDRSGAYAPDEED